MNHIYILGDLICTDEIKNEIISAQFSALLGKPLCDRLFSTENYVVVNLEGPITDSEYKLKKGGSPNIKSSYEIIDLLNHFPNCIVSGANNHITDYGPEGITDTIQILKKHNIKYIGFGTTKEDLNKYEIFEINGMKIGVVSYAQNEFCTMDSYEKGIGATPYDPLVSFDAINAIKRKVNYLLVLFHGGKENYRFPTPMQARICRKMIDSGADSVICQHSHCIGCYEDYKGKKIIYGTGNFLFNISDNVLWTTSIIPVLSIEGLNIDIDYIPIYKTKTGVAIAEAEIGVEILNEYKNRSEKIQLPGVIEQYWENYCRENYYPVVWNAFFRLPNIIRYVDRILGRKITKKILQNRKKNLTTYNYIRCEAINEMCQSIFRNF